MKRYGKFAGVACLTALLCACAAQPVKQTPASVPIAVPSGPSPTMSPLPPAPPSDLWAGLRSSFVFDDCSTPEARAWARKFTRDPSRFAAQLAAAQPLLEWVQNAARLAGVPGEFALLPMVESSYDPAEPGRHGDPAGMWQIMPATARTLGLRINREYDGRLDPAASTQAVLTMLKEYNEELHDWRLADMAFNAGEYKIAGLVHGRDDVDARHLPVSAITRDHLAKLMAMACIVSDPAHFNLKLPAGNGDELTLVILPQPMQLALAARIADMSLDQLRHFNPGYRGERMPEDAPHHLLLPQTHAEQLANSLNTPDTLLAKADAATATAVPLAPTTSPAEPPPSAAIDPPSPPKAAAANVAAKSTHASRHHRVAHGESLWSIAHRYGVSPSQLRAWNALASDALKPGQSLLVSQPD